MAVVARPLLAASRSAGEVAAASWSADCVCNGHRELSRPPRELERLVRAAVGRPRELPRPNTC